MQAHMKDTESLQQAATDARGAAERVTAECAQLRANSDRLQIECDRLRAECDRLRMEDDRLQAECDRLNVLWQQDHTKLVDLEAQRSNLADDSAIKAEKSIETQVMPVLESSKVERLQEEIGNLQEALKRCKFLIICI